MLTGLLKNKGLLPFLISAILATGLLIQAMFVNAQYTVGNELLASHWAFGWLYEKKVWLLSVGLLLIIFNAAVTRFRSHPSRSALGSGNIAMVVFLSVLLTQKGMLLRPDVLGASLVIIGMFTVLFSMYDHEGGLFQLFHVGMLLGVAVILVGQSVLLALAVYFALFIQRSSNWRERTVPLLGVAMVVVFIFLILVWADRPLSEFQRLMQTAWHSPLSTPEFSIGHIILTAVLVFAIPQTLRSLTSGTVAERDFTVSLLGWLTAALLCVPALGLGWQSGVVFAACPISILVARSLESMGRWWLADLLLIVVLAAPLINSL